VPYTKRQRCWTRFSRPQLSPRLLDSLFHSFFGGSIGGVPSALLTVLALATPSQFFAHAQESAACEMVPIEVDIFFDTGAEASDIVAMETQTGQYNECPPESTYWEHLSEVFGGYKGCVGEKALYPCPNDASSIGDIYNQTPIVWDGESCVETEYTMENRTFVISGGNPYDTYELNARTGVSSISLLNLADRCVPWDS
jgi:hypothetical protein